jgi:hypothetical protein
LALLIAVVVMRSVALQAFALTDHALALFEADRVNPVAGGVVEECVTAQLAQVANAILSGTAVASAGRTTFGSVLYRSGVDPLGPALR